MTPQSRDRWEFLSTPSARRATRVRHQFSGLLQISIHALREEGDSLNKISGRWDNISIHALREEGDSATISCCRGFITFLSTPSARRATV